MFILFTMNIVPVHGNIREWVYESNYSFFPQNRLYGHKMVSLKSENCNRADNGHDPLGQQATLSYALLTQGYPLCIRF